MMIEDDLVEPGKSTSAEIVIVDANWLILSLKDCFC